MNFLRYVWAELARNDETYEPAAWYAKGNTLLAHVSLATLIAMPIYVAFPMGLADIICTILVAAYFFKENNDVRDGGISVLWDSMIDSTAVASGTVISAGLVHGVDWLVMAPVTAITLCWLAYPLWAFYNEPK